MDETTGKRYSERRIEELEATPDPPPEVLEPKAKGKHHPRKPPEQRLTPEQWGLIRADYITSELSLPEIARRHNVTVGSVTMRAYRDNWSQSRKDHHNSINAILERELTRSRLEELKAWNDGDIKLAQMLRSKATHQAMNLDATPRNLEKLRTIAAIVESTQRIARLAMGAPTNNTGIGNMDGSSINPPKLGDFYDSLKFVPTPTDAHGQPTEQ